MTDIPLQFSIIDLNPMLLKKRKSSASNNNLLNNNYLRSRPMTSNGTLPIITVPSFSNFKEKLLRMATNKKSITLFNTPIESSMTQIKPRTISSNRSNASTKPKSSLSHPTTATTTTRPTTSHRTNYQQQQQQQQSTQLLYVVNTPTPSHQSVSPHLAHTYFNPSPQQHSIVHRSQYQYGHFLAHLRKQSLARTRRKQQQEQGHTDNIETTITFNLNKNQTSQTFQSSSNYSIGSLTTDSSSTPIISITAKRPERPISNYRQFQRSIKNFRLNSIQQSQTQISKDLTEQQLLSLQSSSLLITPRNSVVDETGTSTIIKPSCDLHLNDDMLNYCYVSGDSGIKYQGQMFPTAF
ncbi:unnamed protein product [Rotaria sordida]|uniref:Uncharacterized protein n=1 Tax=Rotaria sordida TaxID=392033 RepID=A0A814CSB3_9BILA|nr:unnamed protein product [Rotaria sordida]CAF0946213.1 unnamed protein product [Rotaria sordida]CAF1238687.1 unnamed protein product [Rotaria sordida]CAF3799793.1 unnamed protein product [Rotaria sordida]CAF3899331.1 unnamed protein product [Rotaria sordida]